MTETARSFGINLLIATQWLASHVLRIIRRHPRQSLLGFLMTLMVLLPTAHANQQINAPGVTGNIAVGQDALGEELPDNTLGVKLGQRGWWTWNHERLSSPWMMLLSKAHQMGWRGELNSGIRTYGEQAHLYSLFVRGLGAPAFKPNGPSRHLEGNVKNHGGWYQAVDVTYPLTLMKLARRIGVPLHQPYVDEPWHLESAHPFSAQDIQ